MNAVSQLKAEADDLGSNPVWGMYLVQFIKLRLTLKARYLRYTQARIRTLKIKKNHSKLPTQVGC